MKLYWVCVKNAIDNGETHCRNESFSIFCFGKKSVSPHHFTDNSSNSQNISIWYLVYRVFIGAIEAYKLCVMYAQSLVEMIWMPKMKFNSIAQLASQIRI